MDTGGDGTWSVEENCGRLLGIDLTHRQFKASTVDSERLRRYIGGKGVGMSLLAERDRSPLEDPFHPGNPLIFTTGPLTGSLIQTSARSAVVTRSPLTGGFLDSHAGGHFGPAMRRSGWDYILIEGRADEPLYLLVSPEGVEFNPADDLWGKDVFHTERTLKERHRPCEVASIGQAGENLVRYAAIATGLHRHYGRGGAGAVMGSKNLKALVVKGGERIRYAREEEFRSLARSLTEDLREHPNAKKRRELGTMMWIRMGQEIGHFLPTRNFQRGEFDGYERITSENMRRELKWTSKGCYGCGVIQCSKVSRWDGKEMEGPEYETTAYLGSNCEIDDPRAVAEANWLCDRYGLDTISTGVTIAFAMECAEKGLLSPEDNRRIRFGSPESVHTLIEEIAMRKGIGDILAEGTRRAAEKIGKDSGYFAINIAGMEISGVNPLGSYSMALALVTSDFASHTRLWTATDEMMGNLRLEDLPEYIKRGQDEINARNSMIVCDFLPYGLDRLVSFLNAATGFDYTVEELMKAGERMQTLSRWYNLKTGRTHGDDTLPPRFFEEESFAGLMKGKKIPRDLFEEQMREIYRLRGWDEEGRPTEEKMKDLGVQV
ncbi:MAG: aldehyde ferredoxin oxidoreductase family protein [Thermoplasmata archaeon]|nr:aldehyde ferredoxin oxidoreductase family protein [Thermoplasmata archaeon]